jgi:hypothetical protein
MPLFSSTLALAAFWIIGFSTLRTFIDQLDRYVKERVKPFQKSGCGNLLILKPRDNSLRSPFGTSYARQDVTCY